MLSYIFFILSPHICTGVSEYAGEGKEELAIHCKTPRAKEIAEEEKKKTRSNWQVSERRISYRNSRSWIGS